MTKFSSQLDREVLEQLRALAKETHRTLASVLNEAATDEAEGFLIDRVIVGRAELTEIATWLEGAMVAV